MKTPFLAVLVGMAGWFAPANAQAHDILQSNTDIWLRPDRMEVNLTMARAPSRELVDHPPPVPVTEDNFEATYHSLLNKSAASLFEITLDGQPLQPISADAALLNETDIQFTLVYPRPASGKLQITASFIKKLDDGYVNTLAMNEDRNVLGYGDQSTDNLTWEIRLGQDADGKPPTAKPPTIASADAGPHDSYFVIAHYHYLLLGGLLIVIILLAMWLIRQKSSS